MPSPDVNGLNGSVETQAAGRDRSESPPLVQSDHHVITENGKAPEDKRKKDVSSVEDEGWGICCFDR